MSDGLSRPPRRVALVTQGFTGGGGVATVTRWLRDGLVREGYTVDVHDLATSREDANSRRIANPSTWTRSTLRGPFDEQDNVQPWGGNAVEVEPMRYGRRSELSRVLSNYDIVQVVAGGPALACAAIGAGPPVFLQVATRMKWERRARQSELLLPSRVWSGAMTAWVTRLEIKAIAAVDTAFVENAEMQAFAHSVGQRNAVLAPPGVDTDRFLPRSGGWNADGHLLSVCRLAEPRKRLDRLIRAYYRLICMDRSTPDLVLAGRGRLPEHLHRLIAEHGLTSRVQVRSDIHPDELPAVYQGASVYLQTSDEEGLGISVLEAMSSGLPVIATDTSGARECVQNGVTGWLVRVDEEARLTRSIAEFVRCVLGSGGREMSLLGRERCVENFGSHYSLRRFTHEYERVLRGPYVL